MRDVAGIQSAIDTVSALFMRPIKCSRHVLYYKKENNKRRSSYTDNKGPLVKAFSRNMSSIAAKTEFVLFH